ncbi:DnaD domain-containing protein [Chloroflexota bacterium]
MSKEPFPGFPIRSRLVPLPDLFFTRLLPEIDSLREVKLVLHVFWLLSQKNTNPKFVSYEELSAEKTLLEEIEGEGTPDEVLRAALESAIDRGVLLHLALDSEGEPEDLYFVNTKSNKRIVTGLQSGELSLKDTLTTEPHIGKDKLNIFSLYEQNIGPLTPMIAEELKEAENIYPVSWIEEAFKEAVDLNKRKWRYISRILENWDSEGKESGKSRRYSKKEEDPDRYIKGKYGHVVQR